MNVTGEVGFVRYRPKENQLRIPVLKPGQRVIIDVDLETRTATIDRRYMDIWQRLLALHRTPGPHNSKFPPNWIVTNIWSILADVSVYLILFVTASGVYLWSLIKAERKIGLVLLGSGALSFILIVFAFMG